VGRIVVLSPHSDDGVLSLGASLARWTRSGRQVELVTVFALDPGSTAETGGWDGRAGFRTEGDAARARREEDRAACAILGVTPLWLPFGSVDYERHGDEDAVWDAVRGTLEGAGVVLLPGSPLTHPDHEWLHTLVVERLPAPRLARYAEQPYTLRASGAPFARIDVGARDRLAKWRAVGAYRSQLPLLALAGRRSRLRLVRADERVELPEGRVDLPL
jgi:LmbE family N-acetylglucosaminyl deacetylase